MESNTVSALIGLRNADEMKCSDDEHYPHINLNLSTTIVVDSIEAAFKLSALAQECARRLMKKETERLNNLTKVNTP